MEWWRVRAVANALNGSTLLGLATAAIARARLLHGDRGLVLAAEHRLPFRVAAFTIGNVILTPYDAEWLTQRPALLRHEERHASQYAACLGLPMLPLYAAAAAYSWLRCGNRGTHNMFERWAGLVDGGYLPRPQIESEGGGRTHNSTGRNPQLNGEEGGGWR